jgi:probable phosphoglycerate mutase
MLQPRPFYYLRHGETDWNCQGLLQGAQDVPLNARGLAQAEAAREQLRGQEIAMLCTSPLKRARRTAEIVNEALEKDIVVIEDLAECGFGPYEGQQAHDWFPDWRRGITPPGVEPYRDFLERSLKAVNAALDHPGPVLIVAHGGVYWSIQIQARLPQSTIPNAQAIHHAPPARPEDRWKSQLLEAQGLPDEAAAS